MMEISIVMHLQYLERKFEGGEHAFLS
jgi:hypothetical protein